MKINEVEALVGITKKNIRFYEKEGLLSPSRNSDNGYRDYGEAEVRILRRIKLLRKLGLPLEEIRRMEQGCHTVSDSVRRHLITLDREARNLRQSMELCQLLQEEDIPLSQLDPESYLRKMEEMELRGATFMNRQRLDTRPYAAPALVTTLMTLLMGSLIVLLIWMWATNPQDAPPLPLLLVLACIPAAVILGVIAALIQRFRELGEHHLDDATKS